MFTYNGKATFIIYQGISLGNLKLKNKKAWFSYIEMYKKNVYDTFLRKNAFAGCLLLKGESSTGKKTIQCGSWEGHFSAFWAMSQGKEF